MFVRYLLIPLIRQMANPLGTQSTPSDRNRFEMEVSSFRIDNAKRNEAAVLYFPRELNILSAFLNIWSDMTCLNIVDDIILLILLFRT